MSTIKKYTPFFISALLMAVVLFIIYPHYQYYIDPDGTAYLTISQRYANGDFFKAVNGLWSPWGCWITALLINMGLPPIPASVITNSLGAAGFLFITQSFFLKFNITSKLQWLFNITLALFLCYAIFWQSFDDLWECFFLLSTFRIMLSDGFNKKPVLWIVYSIVGALAYFAKAYALPFFVLNTVCCTYFISNGNKTQWLRISFITITIMLLLSFPWIYALHAKYGEWLTSTAGPLNMTWFLVGHPYWKNGINVLLPPSYRSSPSYWEDPYFIHGIMPHFWDSLSLAGLQVLRLGLNAYKLAKSMLQLSVFFPAIVAIALLFLLRSRVRTMFTGNARILIISFLVFPLFYIPVDFQSRFLWYMFPLSIIIGVLYMEQALSKQWQRVLPVLFVLTVLIFPAMSMSKMYDEGTDDYKVAQQLDSFHIHGTFACMARPGIESQRITRLGYFSGNRMFAVSRPGFFTEKDVLKEMRNYHVNYFFAYGTNAEGSDFRDELGRPFPELIKGRIPGLKVFIVNPL